MRKRLAMLLASLFLVWGMVWAQTPVLKLTSGQIGTTYPYELSAEDAAKVFALTDLTVAVRVNTPASLSSRRALFCTSDPTQAANTTAMGTNSHYVAYGTSEAAIGYLASCVTGDRFTKGGITADATGIVLAYVISPTNNTCKLYIDGEEVHSWVNAHNDGFMSGYEIATPKMVKEDHPNAQIYIGGGVKSDNATFETFNGTITGVEVYDGVLTAEQVAGLFPAVFDPGKQYALKSPTGTYFNFTASGTTAATFQSAPSYFYITEESEAYIFESVDNPGTYIGCSSSNTWDVSATTTSTKWNISEADEDGYVTISKNSGTGNLGSDDNTEVGTGIYANVGDKCFKWLIEEKAEDENENYTFAPEIGKMYALQESTSGLYLDIQTLGVKDGSRSGDNISLNIKPSIIFFEEGSTENTWKLKNANGKYVSKGSDGVWNPVIGDASHDWIIAIGANEQITIARATGEYINIEGGISAGKPLYNDKSTALQFSLIEYSDLNRNYCVLKSPSDTYLNLTQVGDTEVSFQSAASELYITPSADAFYLESKDNAGTFIGSTHNWNTTKDFSLWTISNKNDEGLVLISRNNATGEKINLGHDTSTDAGTGIFTNVGNGCFLWQIQESIDCPTAATIENNKYHFTSDRMWYTAPCNKLRFTLTESGAFYQNGSAKRLSFDSFVLYDANGDAVTLSAKNITGNNITDFTNMLDGANGTYCNYAWSSGTEDDWFEVTLPYGVDLAGAFSFSFVTENTTMNAKAFQITTSYEAPAEYTFNITGQGENEVTVTLGEETLTDGALVFITAFDADAVVATDLSGYTWKVVVDHENATITLIYTEAPIVENPAAVVDLVNRIGGAGTADKFKFVLDPSMNSKQEVFSINGEDGKVLIKGSSISALTMGLGWYLQNVAHINIAWNSLNEKTVSGEAYADLSNLPLPAGEETHTSDAKYRYYLNTCTFGYSMTSWTWKRWQQEIDWMALHGINMPLQLVGLEEVWRTFLTMEDADGNRKYGYTDEEAKAFVAGPAFIAWWAMNNLEGWGGTGSGTKSGGTWEGAGGVQDDAWYARQKNLAKQIVEAQRALGMQPVLPGWSGMVPTNFASKSTYATRGNGVNWAGDFVRPLLLNTSIGADKYAEIAADYYACLKAVMGESQYYSMDPFHEGGGAGTMEDYEALYAAMEAAKAGSQWVIQQWQWSATQRYSLTAVPAGRLIVLDLFADGSPAFDTYNGYAPQDAVFSTIPNFGGRSGLMGRLQNVTDNYFSYKAKYASIKGIGAAPEAIEQTPVAYDLIFQLPWMNGVKPDVAAWVDNYAVARYGKDNAVVKEAWSLLRQGPLNYGADAIQGPVEDVWAARPNLNANAASYWGKTLNNAIGTYTKARHQMLIDAVYKLLSQKETLALTSSSVYESNYNYDLVEFGGAVMADYAYYLLKGINEAKTAGNTTLYESRRDAFLQLILDVDAFKGTNLNFRLGKWTQEARDAAAEVTGATTATPDWYEYNNARTIVSTWSSPNTNLNDYSYRSWQGLMKDLYYPRWKHYFDNNCTGAQYGYFEWNWAHGKEHYVGQTAVSDVALTAGQAGHTDSYTREPEGNTVEQAVEMLRKYIIPIHMNDGTIYYAYRTFTYDLEGKVTVNVAADATVDFTHYFDIPDDATITGDFINNDEGSAPVKAVPVKPEEAVYTATITLADGTRLENFTVHTPSFNGVYKVSLVTDWGNTPVFIQYNENDNVSGYKMVAASDGYSTDSELDKWFSIAHSGDGYTISAQGKYLKEPLVWEYVLFSEDEAEAGTYLFDDSDTHDIYKIVNVDGYHLQAWSYVMALEPGNASPSTFVFEKVEGYSVTFPTDSFTTVYLPFNVLLPVGVEAYDVCGNELVNDEKDHGQGALEKIANSGDILKAGTPAVLKGAPGEHMLEIVMHSNKAKSGLPYSALRGSYEKHTLVHTDDIKKFVLHEKHFDDLQTYYKTVLGNEEGEAVVEMPANTCWLEVNIEANQIGLTEGSFVKIEDWLIMYESRPKGILLSSIAVSGDDGTLVIPSIYNINGEDKQIVAISGDFFKEREDITSVTLPATLSDVGASKLTYLDQVTYHGFAESKTGEVGQFLNAPLYTPITGANTWRMTVGVKIDSKEIDFNQWGSAILATKDETLADHYDDGSMQLYLKNDHDSIIFKLDNADDRYTFCCKNPDGTTLVNDTFTFVLDNDGSGGYDAKVIFANGKEQIYAITASDKAELKPFRNIFSSMPEGMHVTVTFEDKVNDGLFVGCTNLQEIIVEDGSESFSSVDGVLYSKDGTHIIRFPEGGKDTYDIDKKVTRLNPGSLHGVDADITFHSNPKILFVAGHEDHMKARYYLSLEDVDKVDFESDNTNTFETVRYERAPLAEGKFGTFFLPFVPENIMEKYDFFELVGGDNAGLVFSQVEEVEANKPYLYTLKEDVASGNGNDEFTAGRTTIISVGDSVHVTTGDWMAFGTYRNDYVQTSKYKDSYYYYLSASSGMFHRVTQRLDLRPFRAYFVWVPEKNGDETVQAAPKLALRFRDGSTTEIDPSQVEGMETPIYYDLQGRRVENPTSGVYIVNGKKVVIR